MYVIMCLKERGGGGEEEMPNQLMCVLTMWHTEGEWGDRRSIYPSVCLYVCFERLSCSRSKLRNSAGDGADVVAGTCVRACVCVCVSVSVSTSEGF